ncbi:hypothetical protein [Novacetimonas hansenii]|nr:hypothetical protein [Novacetimonas hansenii]WEQ60562.1 hypothetical protein LV563_14655 [Novacetimonas hansenii]
MSKEDHAEKTGIASSQYLAADPAGSRRIQHDFGDEDKAGSDGLLDP